MTRALLTGASSYLGLQLARRLLGDGVSVHAVVRAETNRERLDRLHGDLLLHEHDGTLTSMIGIVEAAKPETVFHIAAKYLREHAPGDVDDLIDSNVRLGMHLLEAMVENGVERLVNTGTAFQHFDVDGDAYRPLSLYAATKQAFEDILAYYVDAHGIRGVTLKLFEVYGPGDWRPKFPAMVRAAQRNGEALALPADDVPLDMVFIDDVVTAFLSAARLLDDDPGAVVGRSFAVSSGQHSTLDDVVRTFEAIAGVPVERAWARYETPERVIRRPWRGPVLPGWRPAVGLEAGIRRLLESEGRA